jgi:hypothetical protein
MPRFWTDESVRQALMIALAVIMGDEILNGNPETAISMNRNGSRTLCVFKVHYRDPVGSGRKLLEIYADLVFGPYDLAATLKIPSAHLIRKQ